MRQPFRNVWGAIDLTVPGPPQQRAENNRKEKWFISTLFLLHLGGIAALVSKGDPNLAGPHVVALRTPTLFWH
jgi:hypothetical protein